MTRPKPISEDRIRERAYLLWLEEGQPEGKSAEHWEKARELLALEPDPEEGAEGLTAGHQSAPQGAPEEDVALPGESPTVRDEKAAKKRRPSVSKKRPM